MSLDLLQYFLEDFGIFENFVKIWTRSPPNYYQNASQNTRSNMASPWTNIMYVNLGLNKIQKESGKYISYVQCFFFVFFVKF